MPGSAAHLLSRSHCLKHFADALGWRKAQVFDQQSQVDPECLGRRNAASRAWVEEPLFRPGQAREDSGRATVSFLL